MAVASVGLSAGSAYMRILPDFTGFGTQLQRGAQNALTRVGAGLSRVGSTLTRNLSLPLLAVAGVSTKMAVDFETAFTRIAAVSNTSAKSIKEWRGEVQELAGRTARDPIELANALYFLASAGLANNQIMPTLRRSAQAAASGLGDTADIARLTANALNAYAGSGLTATRVTDVLVAAVREGTAEPQEFAAAMGRILPIAAKAEVGFDQIAASLATLSNAGLDVNEGVTAMRGVLIALEAPGTQAADTLKEIGISTNEMRKVISEQGILGALRLLEDRTGGNIDQIRKIIPNVRALTGVFNLTGQEADKVNGIFARVSDSTGSLDKAFERTTKGPGFKFQQTLTRLKVAAIDLGEKLLPIAESIARVVGRWAEAFSRLSPAMQSTIVHIGLFAIAAGPLLRVLGPLVSLAGRLGGALTSLAANAGAAATGTALGNLAHFSGTAAGGLTDVAAGATAAGGSLAALSATLGPVALLVGGLAASYVLLRRTAGTATTSIQTYATTVARSGRNSEAAAEAQADVTRAWGKAAIVGQRLADSAADIAQQQRRDEQYANRYGNAIKTVTGKLLGLRNGLSASTAAQINQAIAAGKQTRAAKLLLTAIDNLPARKVTQLRTQAPGAFALIRQLKAQLASIPDRKYVQIIVSGAEVRAHEFARTGGARRGPIAGQHGWHGWVTEPQWFLAGEAGRERVDITPRGRGNGKSRVEGRLRIDWRANVADLEGLADWREYTRGD